MSEQSETKEVERHEDASLLSSLIAQGGPGYTFGPSFFLTHLRALVRDHCPAPGDVPTLDLWLDNSDVLHVCHVVGVSLAWVAVAVREAETSPAMQLVMVPYSAITRVILRGGSSNPKAIGFESAHRPLLLQDSPKSAEQLLAQAALATNTG